MAGLRGDLGMVHNVPGVRAHRPMLTLVPYSTTRQFADARELMSLIESTRLSLLLVVELILLPLLAVVLLATGLVWGWSLIGATLAFALRRYGPRWWPGKKG